LNAEKLYSRTLPNFYVHNKNKRFVQIFLLTTDIVGTFMGTFNANNIQKLKSQFQNMSQGHNMLVEMIQQHNVDIIQMKESLKSIVDVIYLMTEYHQGLLQLQISEELGIFVIMVTIITNAI
jgi:transcription antitermination factor NusA-like protein